MKQYRKLFEMDGVELEFTEDALEAVADQAILRGTGARGLRAIMEEVLLPVMYDIPSRDDVAKVVVTEQTVRENVNPTIVPRRAHRPAASAGNVPPKSHRLPGSTGLPVASPGANVGGGRGATAWPRDFWQRERTVAPPGWSRWLSRRPRSRSTSRSGRPTRGACSSRRWRHAAARQPNAGVLTALPFELGIIMLGLSAAFVRHPGRRATARGGRWSSRRRASSAGFLISALGLLPRQYWLVVLGYGFVGGIGLGIGYISPVSTLIKWFPDRPGLATGIAIMGFGGGALIASPLTDAAARRVRRHRADATSRASRADLPRAWA